MYTITIILLGGFTNNTRVRILHITQYRIVVQTLGDQPRRLSLPRIRFKVKLPYGHGFEMVRLQFPLRRAFAMTSHKSQSQTVEKAVWDIRDPMFAHGQLYTGASRVRNPRDLAWVVDANTLCHIPESAMDDDNVSQLYHFDDDNAAEGHMEVENQQFDFRPYIGNVYVDNIVYPEAIEQCLP